MAAGAESISAGGMAVDLGSVIPRGTTQQACRVRVRCSTRPNSSQAALLRSQTPPSRD